MIASRGDPAYALKIDSLTDVLKAIVDTDDWNGQGNDGRRNYYERVLHSLCFEFALLASIAHTERTGDEIACHLAASQVAQLVSDTADKLEAIVAQLDT